MTDPNRICCQKRWFQTKIHSPDANGTIKHYVEASKRSFPARNQSRTSNLAAALQAVVPVHPPINLAWDSTKRTSSSFDTHACARTAYIVVIAFEQLLAEGYIESRTGAGTFVTETLPEDVLQVETRPLNGNRAVGKRRNVQATAANCVAHQGPQTALCSVSLRLACPR